MLEFLKWLFGSDDKPVMLGRDPRWERESATYRKENPDCVVCGGVGTEVHHKIPFHLRPALEMVESNWATVCRPHHLLVGHLMSWFSWTPAFDEDANNWRRKIAERPKP